MSETLAELGILVQAGSLKSCSALRARSSSDWVFALAVGGAGCSIETGSARKDVLARLVERFFLALVAIVIVSRFGSAIISISPTALVRFLGLSETNEPAVHALP